MRALQEFIDAYDDNSDQIALGFLNLKHDIAAFMVDFRKWISTLGLVPNAVADLYRECIEKTAKEIAELDERIFSLQSSLAIAGSTAAVLGDLAHDLGQLISNAANLLVLLSLLGQRNGKTSDLADWQAALLNLQQTPILQLQAKLECLKPDLDQMLDKMVRIGEIWSSVRSQAVQFKGHIEGGLEASRNIRFKSEVKLAREVCGPLVAGLRSYMQALRATT